MMDNTKKDIIRDTYSGTIIQGKMSSDIKVCVYYPPYKKCTLYKTTPILSVLLTVYLHSMHGAFPTPRVVVQQGPKYAFMLCLLQYTEKYFD